MVTIGPKYIATPFMPLGSMVGIASPTNASTYFNPYFTTLYRKGSHPNSSIKAGTCRFSGNFGFNNKEPKEDGWLERTTDFFKRIYVGLVQTFDGSAIPSFAPQMLEFAGTGMVMPTFGIDACEARSAEDAKFANISMMSGDAPPDSFVPNLHVSQKLLKRRLRESKYKDSRIIDAVFANLEQIPASLQQRSLKIAFKMIDWHAPITAVAAALCLHAPESKSDMEIPKEVQRILDNKAELESLVCDWSDARQIDYFRSLMFLMAESVFPFLLLAAEDLIDLEERQNLNLESSPEMIEKAHRSFMASSSILQICNCGDDAGKLEDLALLHFDPDTYDTVEEHLRVLNGMDRAASLKKLRRIAHDIEEVLEMNDLRYQIKLRVKRIASAARRVKTKRNYADTNGIRVILYSNSHEHCYQALFAIHEYFIEMGWEDLLNRKRDYIQDPKPNGYQSLHRGFCDESEYTVDLQIRTRAMDRAAEIGSAAHGRYKTGDKVPAKALREKDAPRILFNAKRQQIIDAGVYFVYDKESDKIVKLVTGSPNRPPTVLDFAFARSINQGLRASTGFVNGIHVKLDSPLSTGQRVEVKVGSSIQVNGRRGNVTTPLAKAALTVTAPNIPAVMCGTFNLQTLVSRGRKDFSRLISQIDRQLTEAYGSKFTAGEPILSFPFERLRSRMGIHDEDLFFATLDALPKRDEKDKFKAEIQRQVRNEGVLYAYRGTKFEMMSTGKSSLLRRLLENINNSGLALASMSISQIRGSSYFITRIATNRGCATGIRSFVDGLKDPNNYTSYATARSASTLNVTVRARMNSPKPKTAMAVVRAVLDFGAEIKECLIPKTSRGQIAEYSFKIQLPQGLSKKRGAPELASMLDEIDGTGQIVIM